jgi:NTE family protein
MKLFDEGPSLLGRTTSPTVAIALGSGGARGLAHVVVLEALDELGIRPVAIAGASIGAIVGATYASGLEARQIHAHVEAALRSRAKVLTKLMRARVGRFSDLVLRRSGNPVMLDAETCLDLFWPDRMPAYFSQLSIPLLVVATDFHASRQVVFSTGALAPAVASSMAVPGLFRPVEFSECVLIDGGAVNPLPYDLLFDHADIVVEVDVTIGGRMRERRMPTVLGSMFGGAQIMQGAITAQKIKLRPPDILLRPEVERFNVLEFMRAAQILRAAESAKDDLKRALSARMAVLQRA